MTTAIEQERKARLFASRVISAGAVCLGIFLCGYLYTAQQQFDAQRARADLFGAIFENAEVPFLVVNDQGLITEWNPAAEKVLGWQRKEVIGSDLIFLMVDPALQYKHADLWTQTALSQKGLLHGRSIRVKCWINRKYEGPFEADLEINEVELADTTHLYTAEIKMIDRVVELGALSPKPGDLRASPSLRPDFNQQQQIRSMLKEANK